MQNWIAFDPLEEIKDGAPVFQVHIRDDQVERVLLKNPLLFRPIPVFKGGGS